MKKEDFVIGKYYANDKWIIRFDGEIDSDIVSKLCLTKIGRYFDSLYKDDARWGSFSSFINSYGEARLATEREIAYLLACEKEGRWIKENEVNFVEVNNNYQLY